jgi:RNA polymerase sigma-54 factor
MDARKKAAEPLLRLPVQALSMRLREAIRTNPLLAEEEDPSPPEQPTGWLALDLDTLEPQYEGADNFVKPMDFDREKMEYMEGLDEEFDEHFAMDDATPKAVEQDVETMEVGHDLYMELKTQLDRLVMPEDERPLAEVLLGYLNSRGYLDDSLEEIAKAEKVSVERVESVLKRLQEELEPAGVASRNARESLLIQLWRRDQEETLAYKILWSHFDDLIHGRWPIIARKLGCSVAQVEKAIHEEIAPLTLRPGSSWNIAWTAPLIPDLIMDGEQVSINQEPLPQLGINEVGTKWLDQGCTASEQKYLESQLASAKRLLKSFEERNRLLLRIGRYLADAQSDYLSGGRLQPLTFRHVATTLDLPLTTIQRAVAGKLAATPRGIIPLRAFFTNGYNTDAGPVSSHTIRQWISEWIASEDSANPLTDAQISTRLQEQGLTCSRRTIAKYRSQLSLGTANKRKKQR